MKNNSSDYLKKEYKRSDKESNKFQKVELKQIRLHTTIKGKKELMKFYESYEDIYNTCIDIHRDVPLKDDKRKMIVNLNGKLRKPYFDDFNSDHLEQGIIDFHKNLNSFNAQVRRKIQRARFILDNIDTMEDYKEKNGFKTINQKMINLDLEKNTFILKFRKKIMNNKISFSKLFNNYLKTMKEFNDRKKKLINWKEIRTKECNDIIKKYENIEFVKKEETMSFPIKHRLFNTNKFKERIGLYKDVDISKDTRIIYNRVKGFWYIIQFKTYNYMDDYIHTGNILSLDPGIRTFHTGISTNGSKTYYGHEFRQSIRGYHKRIDKIDSILASNKRVGKYKKKRRGRLKKRKKKNYYVIKNRTKQLHYSSIKDMLNENDIILLPKYNSSKMMTDLDHKKSKRENASLEHFKFKQRLIHKANQKSKKVLIVSEFCTTITCFNCKHKHKKGEINNEIFNCRNCGIMSSRDMNACKNIMYNNTKNIIETLVSGLACCPKVVPINTNSIRN